ncbi:MAG: transcription repressor NadR [Collinsella sp.]|nr:transcription repressor NadR [Collinsella sp.]
MSGEERRARLCELLREARAPIPGYRLGELLGVSRQVIVQDIALIRSRGTEVSSTSRGYRIHADRPERILKMHHSVENTQTELNTIVDHGGRVEDVSVNHRTYGLISAPMRIASRRDVERFIRELETGASSLLMTVTAGYHFHRISAESEAVLDEIEQALMELGFCADRLPYESDIR